MSARACFLIVGAMVGWHEWAAAQSDRTQAIVDRATTYVERFVDELRNVVAEERYLQQTTYPRRRRELISDFLLVKPRASDDWYQFRDVRVVDGKPVTDREARLEKLFLEPWDRAVEQATALAQAGARYNLRDVGSLNRPLIALAFLQRHYRERFRFSVGGREKSLGPDVWLVNFDERRLPTVLRRADANTDLPSRGRVWVEEATGRVRKTELLLQVSGGRFPTRIETMFALDDRLQVAVPVEMHDWHPFGTDELEGRATYGRFRRFEVRTDEAVTPGPN